MPSPFPGMDPYLESPGRWPDFHFRFINYWCEAVSEVLPEHYEARIEERFCLTEIETERARVAIPDVTVSQIRPPAAPTAGSAGVLDVAPVTLPLVIEDEVPEHYVEIVERLDRSVVTVMELLSPTNKTGAGRLDYLAKRRAILRQSVHLVELDLLVGGQRLPVARPLPRGDYYAFVARSEERPNCAVFAWSVRQPLPPIPIPLQSPDPDIRIDLPQVFSLAYDKGRYARSLPYAQPPLAPLADADRQWAAALAARKR